MVQHKTLISIVLVTLIISLLSGILGIMYVSYVRSASLPVGHATQDTGTVSISVGSFISITPDDGLINFTGCSPGQTIYSNETNGNDQNACPGHIPDSIVIRNDGDLDANVSLNFSNWGAAQGGTFLDSASGTSSILYTIRNASGTNYSSGCLGGLPSGWTTVPDGSRLQGCDQLSSDNTYNSFSFDVGFFIPSDVQAGNTNLEISFEAMPS